MSTFRARQLVPSTISVPTLPAIVQKVQRMLENPDCGAKEVGLVVAQDAPLAARVLKIANSAYYGLRERCMLPQNAATILGVRVLRSVITQAAVMRQYEHLRGGEFDLDSLWKHSILVAQCASFLGKRCRRLTGLSPDELHVCGLLHDLGQVVMLECMRNDYLEVVRWAKQHQSPLYLAEQQRLGFTHADVGHIVAQQWGLPPQVAVAILSHHGPNEDIASNPVVALIANTNMLVTRVLEGNLSAAATVFDASALQFLGLTADDITAAVQFVDGAKSTVAL